MLGGGVDNTNRDDIFNNHQKQFQRAKGTIDVLPQLS